MKMEKRVPSTRLWLETKAIRKVVLKMEIEFSINWNKIKEFEKSNSIHFKFGMTHAISLNSGHMSKKYYYHDMW